MASTDVQVATVTEPVPSTVQILSSQFAEAGQRHAYAIGKRIVDLVGALLLCIAMLPVIVAVALLVRVTSKGPVFLRQTRCGVGGKEFTCVKFRTMVHDAHNRRDEVQHLNHMTGPVFKIRNDPRCTPVGRWLRRLSIDELPQLWNVLRGDMSLVGPRPALPAEVAQYTPHQGARLLVKPGLTGLWQISGRADLDFDRWVELDLEYIRRRSLLFDCWILLCTIPAVLSMRGAY